MAVFVTLVSENDLILRLVYEFAHGLGCPVDIGLMSSGHSIRIEVDDDDRNLVELLTHVALSAAKAGVDVTEPLCHVTSRGATSDVTLTLRIAEFRIDTATRIRS
jgi:hypothetical protein